MNIQSAQQIDYTLFKLRNNTIINLTINSDIVASYFVSFKPSIVSNFKILKSLSIVPYAIIEPRTGLHYNYSIIVPMRNSKSKYGKKARIIIDTHRLVVAWAWIKSVKNSNANNKSYTAIYQMEMSD